MTTVFTLAGSMIFDASVITLVFSVILASVAYGSKTIKTCTRIPQPKRVKTTPIWMNLTIF